MFRRGVRVATKVIDLWVLLGALVLASVVGLLLRARNGRVRRAAAGEAVAVPAEVRSLLPVGARVTLLQVSTTFCAPCRQARVLLGSLAESTDGLEHVDLDVTDRPELAERLRVLRTPTTLAVDNTGRELLRIGGVPHGPLLVEALRPYL